MSLITRSATIQLRVVPAVKVASTAVLSRIGLTMSEAVELFLRRVIAEERIPFEIRALETDQTAKSGASGEGKDKSGASLNLRSLARAPKKGFKMILGAHVPGSQRRQNRSKKMA